RATILIYVKRHNTELNFSETFEAKILEEIVEAEEIFTPKTLVSMDDFAAGEVIIINNSAQNQKLVANTRLLSPENLLFRLTEAVVIPAHQEIKAKVKADKPGQEYEIGPSRFTIPGLSPILQTKIYAESKEPMTGGFKKIGLIAQKDLDEATTSLKDKLQKQAITNLEKKIKDPNLKIALRSEIIENKSDTKVNEEKEKFTVKMTLKTVAALIAENELLKKTNEKLLAQIPVDQKLASINQSTFAYRLKSYDKENQKATLEIYIAGQTMLSENSDLLAKNYFINKTKEEIKNYLQNIKDVEKFKIRFSPFFIKRAPKNENKIIIKTL
ncbi:MAG: hypothetical protein ACPL3E_02825, partial [Minisyncoccia bacterium]